METALSPSSRVVHQEALRLIRSAPSFSRLTDREADRLLDACRFERLPEGALLQRRGEPADRVFILLEGTVWRSSGPGRGEVLSPVSSTGEIEALSGEPFREDAVALQQASGLCVDRRLFTDLMLSDPNMCRKVLLRAAQAISDRVITGSAASGPTSLPAYDIQIRIHPAGIAGAACASDLHSGGRWTTAVPVTEPGRAKPPSDAEEREESTMELTTRLRASACIVELPGDHLDASNAKDFKKAVSPLLEQHSLVVFDLSRLDFVDSSGIGALLSSLRRLNARGGELKLCGVTKPVRALFELVRMHRIFEIYNDADEAVEALTPATV